MSEEIKALLAEGYKLLKRMELLLNHLDEKYSHVDKS